MLHVLCQSEAETERLAKAFVESLKPPLVVGLDGPLGAGKTRFVRAIVSSLGGADQAVVSPTFVLCQHYECPAVTVHHMDAYRIADDDEFLELGVDELFESDAFSFVEWSERVERCLSLNPLRMQIEVVSESARRFTFAANLSEQTERSLLARCQAAGLEATRAD